ncbi:hypothetical protein [Halodesulfurarchaeum sp.]|uniref:hypothetical protein n=1 Tax=Halodesulfurarchaeum sp. TaxID=1980530 RepID=UPI001BC7ED9A|nr:hypothetical protein [Halodesulfurarchaeum sp.]
MAHTLKRSIRDVRDKLLTNPVSPRVETPADINLHYCRYVAKTVAEEVSDDIDIEILEDGGRGYMHTWLRYNGRHYDAECIEGVEEYRNLPFFQRHPEAANRVVPAKVDPAGLRNRYRETLYPPFLTSDSRTDNGTEEEHSTRRHTLVGMLMGGVLLLIAFAGEWAIEAIVSRDTAFLNATCYTIEFFAALVIIISLVVFFALLPTIPVSMYR